jgi:hypothetical protein
VDPPVSSTNKTDCHNITEILLNVALSTINQTNKYMQYFNILDLARDDWEKMKADNGWNEVHLRDNRYNQVIHMVSAARGAEVFYTVTGHQQVTDEIYH